MIIIGIDRFKEEGMSGMALTQAQTIKSNEDSYTINDAMNVLLTKLDDAIDDMEQGKVQTIDEAWEEIDVI